jgi:Protein of unknown function (DUF2845)
MSSLAKLFVVTALCLLLHIPRVEAFYCGRRLVSIGDPQVTVRYKCGDPDDIEWRVTYRVVYSHDPYSGERETTYEPVVIEVWTYNFGPRRFVEELSFEQGRASDIQPIGYGY